MSKNWRSQVNHKRPTVDRDEMKRRDGIMSVVEGESKHIADEKLGKMISSGDFDKMYATVDSEKRQERREREKRG